MAHEYLPFSKLLPESALDTKAAEEHERLPEAIWALSTSI